MYRLAPEHCTGRCVRQCAGPTRFRFRCFSASWRSCAIFVSILLRLRAPATNERGPLYAEHAFAAFYQASPRRLPLQLIFGIHDGSVGLFVAGQNVLRLLVEEQLYASYPDSTLDRLPDGAWCAVRVRRLPRPAQATWAATESEPPRQ